MVPDFDLQAIHLLLVLGPHPLMGSNKLSFVILPGPAKSRGFYRESTHLLLPYRPHIRKAFPRFTPLTRSGSGRSCTSSTSFLPALTVVSKPVMIVPGLGAS
ncbi:hypothetical protein BH24BAC1_BH24BAC1_26490 [soil metagenome]